MAVLLKIRRLRQTAIRGCVAEPVRSAVATSRQPFGRSGDRSLFSVHLLRREQRELAEKRTNPPAAWICGSACRFVSPAFRLRLVFPRRTFGREKWPARQDAWLVRAEKLAERDETGSGRSPAAT